MRVDQAASDALAVARVDVGRVGHLDQPLPRGVCGGVVGADGGDLEVGCVAASDLIGDGVKCEAILLHDVHAKDGVVLQSRRNNKRSVARFPLVIEFNIKDAVVGHRSTTGVDNVWQAREFIAN